MKATGIVRRIDDCVIIGIGQKVLKTRRSADLVQLFSTVFSLHFGSAEKNRKLAC